MTDKKSLTYAGAGVDIERADQAKGRIKKLIESTYNDKVIGGFGQFGGCYSGKFEGYSDPITVSSSDGVGTKIKIAIMMKKYDTVGIDIVHHCVNDIAVMGAEPLFFLDYIGMGRLEPGIVEDIVGGLAYGCKNAGMALIAGETAEMPDIYSPGEFDLAGFIVGVVDRPKILDGSTTQEGDLIYGFASNGLHTNGYSLARQIVFAHKRWTHDKHFPELDRTIGEALMEPHKLYIDILRKLRDSQGVRGFAHVTGGGIPGNLVRIIPPGLTFDIDTSVIKTPAIFNILQEAGNVATAEMYRAFNMGIGLICIVDAKLGGSLFDVLPSEERPVLLGRVVKGDKPKLKFS